MVKSLVWAHTHFFIGELSFPLSDEMPEIRSLGLNFVKENAKNL
jgi:hypothetical protein